MVTPSLSPVAMAVLDDIVSCAACLGNGYTPETLRPVINRMVALSRKMNQLHNDGILTEREYIPLNVMLLVLGINSMNRLSRM